MPAFAKFIAMPPPIVPAPMMPTWANRAQRRVVGHVGDLGGRAFGAEDVAQRARLRRIHQRHEALALQAQRLVDRLGDRHRHRFDALQRCREILRRGAHRVARELQERLGLLDPSP